MRSSKLKIWFWAGVALTLAIAAVISSKKKTNAPEIEIEKVEARVIQSALYLSGQFTYERQARLSPESVGKIEKVFVKEGDTVKIGQPLLQIDDSLQSAQLDQLSAGVKRAELEVARTRIQAQVSEQNYRRKETLVKNKMLSQQEADLTKSQRDADQIAFQSAQFGLDQARSSLQQHAKVVAKSLIRAPLSGLVLSMPIKVGETAISGAQSIAGTELMVIADPSSLIVVANVPESMISRIKLGQHVVLSSRFASGMKFPGQVSKIARSLNQNSVTKEGASQLGSVAIQIQFKLTDAPEGLFAGMTCEIAVQEGSGAATTAVPVGSLRYAETSSEHSFVKGAARSYFVFVANQGKAEKRLVKLGLADEEWQEITSGVKVGEKIVVGPFERLQKMKSGDPVPMGAQ